jgi:transposase
LDDAAGIPQDHWSRLFWEYIFCSFDDAEFAELYKAGGRHPVSPSLLSGITILQYMFKVSDRVAVDNTIMRRDWRIALGITAAYEGFDPSVLCRFRQRLKAKGQSRKLFEEVVDRMGELGLLENRRRLRVDATHLLADVARLSRWDAIQEAIRIVVSDAYHQHAGLRTNVGFMALYERYGEERWVGLGSQSDDRLITLGRDGYRLLGLLGDREVKGQATLAEILQQNFIASDDADGLRPRNGDDPPAEDPIATPHDPDARQGKKGEKTWVGDKVHFVETADQDGRPNVITDVVVTDPRAEDSTMLQLIVRRARSGTPTATTLIADGGYASAQNSKASALMGIDLIAPPRANTRQGKLSIEEFEIDFERQVAICPQGHESVRWQEREREMRICFDSKVCAACPRRSECTDSTRGRTLAPSSEYEQLCRDRERAATEEFANLYRLRSPIEATISELVHCCGLRRSRYRGAPFRELHALLAATALNVRRLLRWLAMPQEQETTSVAAFCPLLAAAQGRFFRAMWALLARLAQITGQPPSISRQPA